MSSEPIRVRPGRTSVVALLEAASLPASDLTDEHMEHFFAAGPASSLLGVAGLEFCGRDALLRSLAVAAGQRSSGLGSALVDRAETHARAHGVRSIYLLTTTAEGFFERRGYRSVPRASAPPEIRETREFADMCPASSAFMVKVL
jgi:amino-acid N-acetyltransferase